MGKWVARSPYFNLQGATSRELSPYKIPDGLADLRSGVAPEPELNVERIIFGSFESLNAIRQGIFRPFRDHYGAPKYSVLGNEVKPSAANLHKICHVF